MILKCIDRAMSSILGKQAAQTLFYAAQENYHLPRDLFAQRPIELMEHLEGIVGKSAFSIFERAIILEIESTFKFLEVSSEKLNLHDALEEARKRFLLES